MASALELAVRAGIEHPIRPYSRGHGDRQIPQAPRQAGCVVSVIGDDQDRLVALGILPGGDQPLDHIAHLGRRHFLHIVFRGDPCRLQDLRP